MNMNHPSSARPFHVAQDPAAYCTVYMLTSPEGKRFIGSTGGTVKQAIANLRSQDHNHALREDLNLFGPENFDVQILCEKVLPTACPALRDRFIRAYGTADPATGYNRMTSKRRPEAQPGPVYTDADAKADREAMEALDDLPDGDKDEDDPVPTTVLLVLPDCLILLTDDGPDRPAA